MQDIFIYSDESGVFDRYNNEYFVFAGVICFDAVSKDIATRKFSHAEKVLREIGGYSRNSELKASRISNTQKGKLYRSLNGLYKFCVLIEQKMVNYKVFENKKHKQRYLDYAYKLVLKRCMETLIENNLLSSQQVRVIFVNADEHLTATDGKYELRESLLNEFKNGTFNPTWEKHFEPVFPRLYDVVVEFCDSKRVFLIRAADIIANHCYHKAIKFNGVIENENNMFVYYLPGDNIGEKGLDYFNKYSQNDESQVKS